MTAYIIISISGLIILSHLFDITQRRIHLPSVLLLIVTGYLIQHIASYSFRFTYIVPFAALKVLGTIGLVLIVLEGVLELKITKKELPNIRRAFFVALLITVVSSLIISYIFIFYLGVTFLNSLLYSIPLSIVSSAILIPSIHKLSRKTREFMIYESIFSDIIGIFLFYFFSNNEILSLISIPNLALNLVIVIVISIVSSYLLIFIVSRIAGNSRIVLTIAILLFLYSFCKIVNLSALLVILVFGLIINNFDHFLNFFKMPFSISKFFDNKSIELASAELRQVNSEITFFIRTLFFLVFGYSLDFTMFSDMNVILIGLIVILVIYSIRFLYFKFLHSSIFPELFLAPRGLITILLFYSIPSNSLTRGDDIGVMYFTVITSVIIMALGLMFVSREVQLS